MSFDREGFKPDGEDQSSLLTRAISNFTPKESSDPLAKEAREVEEEVAKQAKTKEGERKLTRDGKASGDDEQRRKERYKVRPKDEDEEEEEYLDEEEEEGEDEEEEDEFEYEDEGEGEEDEDEGDFDLDLSNPVVRLLVEQNQRLMQVVESMGEGKAQQQEEDAALALGSMDDLFTEDEIIAAQDDPAKFISLLNKTIEHMGTRILQAVPELVNRTYSRKSGMDRTVESFFEKNPLLRNRREFVKHLAKKVVQENPNASAADVLKEAGKRAYKELGLKPGRKENVASGRKKKGSKKKGRRQNAAFARTPRGKSGTQPKKDARNADQKLIDRIVSSALDKNR